MIEKVKEILRKNRPLHFIITYLREKEFRVNYHLYLKNNLNKKSRKTIKQELKMTRDYWGCHPYHYYRYKLYEKVLSADQILDYIPPFYFYNIYWEKRHAGVNKSLYENKFFQHQLFAKYSIPALDIIAVMKKGVVSGLNNEQLTIKELIEKHLIKEQNALFFKPMNGTGGNGIVLLSRKNNTLYLNNQPISVKNILSSLSKDENYLIQERFVQSKRMSEINEFSVNTLRIYTQMIGDEIKVPACILRMGINDSFVDNFAQGGLINIVDVENGNLAEFAQTNKVDKKFFQHPNSKFVFKNSRIEKWQEIKSQIIKFARQLSECKDLGWDVAINDSGIKILEINIQYGLDIQLVYGGMRKILRIYPEA